MGRRALRKIDPRLDLTPYLKTLDGLPYPWDTRALFRRTAPLEVEVGTGKGLFITTVSSERPERNFLGLEISGKYARFAAAKLAKRALTNARIVHGDAQRLFRVWLPDASVAAVHVYFPDPWWKKRHKRRRVFQQQFVRDVERVLVPGGPLHFWTDVEEYFQTTLALIAASTHLAGPFDVSQRSATGDLDYRTHFERRMRLHGEPVYRAEYRKGPDGGQHPCSQTETR
jgi:tRNA (guanine-N7-)-methyltransferase